MLKNLSLNILQFHRRSVLPKCCFLDEKLQYNYTVSICIYSFEWDSQKADSNVRKHGVTFEEAKSVFYDEYARLIPDKDSSTHEERFILMGRSSFSNILIVCHCYRGEDETIRIISARKAEKRECKQYENFRYA